MSVPFAYLGLVVIWSTTPLAIKWSGEGVGFLFGVTTRMGIGLLLGLLVLAALRLRLPWHAQARQVYLAVGIPLFLAMSSVYWGAQQVSSGMISVIFGLTPIFTGLFASIWIKEQGCFRPAKLLGMMTGLAGLFFIFRSSMHVGEAAFWGVVSVLLASLVHSFGTVWVKATDHQLNPLQASIGGLMVAVPLFALSWGLFDGVVPGQVPDYVTASIVYLGVMGSFLGGFLFYYALKHVEASKMALLTLLTPVLALLLGKTVNHETIHPDAITGCVIILGGLVIYHWADRWLSIAVSRETLQR